MKRENYITWDEYFMGIAYLSAMRSKDPSTQVGACIVDQNHKVVSIGYNGMPVGCKDEDMPWSRDGEGINNKYWYVCHAEFNAILNAHRFSLDGCTIYVSLFPCNECAKAIIQTGIKEIVYVSDKYAETDGTKASKFMLDQCGVKYRKFEGRLASIKFDD